MAENFQSGQIQKGRCLCKATTFEYDGPENWVCHCHCDSCRRQCGAPMTTFIGVSREKYRFTGQTPKIYESSKGVRRHFCETCGTPVAFDADHYPDEFHFYAANMEDPHSYSPEFHVHTEEKLSWAKIDDHLPKHEGFYP